jgi:hypothetical protein
MDCNEDCLKNKIKEMLDDDFILRDSVKGINPVENKKVIIDYMLYPKIHLIENGFDPHWVGVEIKYIKDFSESDRGKKSQLLWQAITYSQSIFDIDSENKGIRPHFVVAY